MGQPNRTPAPPYEHQMQCLSQGTHRYTDGLAWRTCLPSRASLFYGVATISNPTEEPRLKNAKTIERLAKPMACHSVRHAQTTPRQHGKRQAVPTKHITPLCCSVTEGHICLRRALDAPAAAARAADVTSRFIPHTSQLSRPTATLATFALSARIHISHEILRPQHCNATPVARLSRPRLSRSQIAAACKSTLRQQPTRQPKHPSATTVSKNRYVSHTDCPTRLRFLLQSVFMPLHNDSRTSRWQNAES